MTRLRTSRPKRSVPNHAFEPGRASIEVEVLLVGRLRRERGREQGHRDDDDGHAGADEDHGAAQRSAERPAPPNASRAIGGAPITPSVLASTEGA